ncbi:MAG: mandelate racemase/muconate lactonizing enzyme family protein [Chloroflexota bacterium]|nr:MAG: mandelate racemase/muconate lactonizing enzyme family protein [Chloroflexota bacterium]
MKIVDVACFVVDPDCPLVRVATDEGVVGWGECYRRAPAVSKATVEQLLRPLLLGADPFDNEVLHRRMMRLGTSVGPLGALGPAVAGVDIALWDIKGKALGVPIWRLLGGKERETVTFYASSLRRDMPPDEEARRVVSLVEAGYRAYKMHSALPNHIDHPSDRTIETVRAIRGAVGDHIQLMVDVNGAFSVHHAIEIGRQLEDLGVFQFEDPVPPEDLEGLARVADALTIPIASGEFRFTRWDFHELIVRGRVDIVQPNVTKVGGLTELLKIAVVASTFHRPIMVHNLQPTIGTAAHLHFCAVQAAASYPQEYNIEPVAVRDRWPILRTPIAVVNGEISVPDGPGLGIDVDEELVRRLAAG